MNVKGQEIEKDEKMFSIQKHDCSLKFVFKTLI